MGLARRDEARRPGQGASVQIMIAGAGVVLLAAVTSGFLTTAWLVRLPTTMFLAVYLGCTASAVRILTGPGRAAAVVSCAAVVAVLCFAGWALIAVVAVIGAATIGRKRRLPVVAPAARPAVRAFFHGPRGSTGAVVSEVLTFEGSLVKEGHDMCLAQAPTGVE